MYETYKYKSKLYNPKKPFYKMSIQELCEHSKICKSLDKTSLKKIMRMEKWDKNKLEAKKRKFLNKLKIKSKTRKREKKNRKTKREKKVNKKKTKSKIISKNRKTKYSNLIL